MQLLMGHIPASLCEFLKCVSVCVCVCVTQVHNDTSGAIMTVIN